jgi:hypothetical protein
MPGFRQPCDPTDRLGSDRSAFPRPACTKVRVNILRGYPSLTREDILAVLRYSSRLMAHHYTLEEVA